MMTPGILLGNEGYACISYLVPPLRKPRICAEKRQGTYNFGDTVIAGICFPNRLCMSNWSKVMTRNVVERTSGDCKRRFVYLQIKPQTKTKRPPANTTAYRDRATLPVCCMMFVQMIMRQTLMTENKEELLLIHYRLHGYHDVLFDGGSEMPDVKTVVKWTRRNGGTVQLKWFRYGYGHTFDRPASCLLTDCHNRHKKKIILPEFAAKTALFCWICLHQRPVCFAKRFFPVSTFASLI